jgi:hypothetical protein
MRAADTGNRTLPCPIRDCPIRRSSGVTLAGHLIDVHEYRPDKAAELAETVSRLARGKGRE